MTAPNNGDDCEDSELPQILGEVRAIVEDQITSLKDALRPILSERNRYMQDMRSQLDKISKTVSNVQEMTNCLVLGTSTSTTSKKMTNPVVAAQLESTEMFLKSDLVSAVTVSSLSKYLASWLSNCDEEKALFVLRLLLFAPGAHSRKKARQTELGRNFMEVRVKIIRNMIYNCQNAVQKDFMPLLQPTLYRNDTECSQPELCRPNSNYTAAGSSSPESARPQSVAFRPPSWTEKGFISRGDVDFVVGELFKDEGVHLASASDGVDAVADGGLVQTQVAKKRKTSVGPKVSIREEVSREIIKHMWKRWTDWFSVSRNEARKSFTLDLGIVFFEPSSRWKPMCSCNGVEEYFESVSILTKTNLSSVFRQNYEATSTNLRLFKTILKDYPNFLVTCQYTVVVFEGMDEMTKKERGQEMTLRRSIHLLEVAANFLIAYFQVSSVEVFLGGGENSLRLIFVVALAFSEILRRASKPRTLKNSSEPVCSEAKELGLLIPGDTVRLNFLLERCLRMTRKAYEDMNNVEGDRQGIVNEGPSGDEICSDDEDVHDIFI